MLLLQVALMLVPLRVEPPSPIKRFLRFSLVAGAPAWRQGSAATRADTPINCQPRCWTPCCAHQLLPTLVTLPAAAPCPCSNCAAGFGSPAVQTPLHMRPLPLSSQRTTTSQCK